MIVMIVFFLVYNIGIFPRDPQDFIHNRDPYYGIIIMVYERIHI